MKSEIKFEVHMSDKSVNFLDVTVNFHSGSLSTTLYTKPTDSHLYLNKSSFHPPNVIKNIPKGQFIRLRRICSNVNEYFKNSKIISQYFINHGYDEKELQKIVTSISERDRSDLLAYKKKRY